MPQKTSEGELVERPPVIAVLGHIDHGKSTLLDFIRKTSTTADEAGGITQHVAAYEISHTHNNTKKHITFIDTPGHEAFAAIRARGADIADIAILAVSAEDGVKPQTLEALEFITKSETPFVVALTKIDKDTSSIERSKQSLAEREIYVEGYGGSIPCVAVSSKTGEGVPELLDMVTLMSEMEELKGNRELLAEGFVLETGLEPKKGIGATIIIKNGHLVTGMAVVAGSALVNVRMMENANGDKISEATFSSPVKLIGWSMIPPIGESFRTFLTKREAEKFLAESKTSSIQDSKIKEKKEVGENSVTVPLVIKADTSGSVEAIEHELKKIKIDRVEIKTVFSGVGDITEKDVKIAAGNNKPVVIGFHVSVDQRLGQLPERIGAEIKTFDIIYRATEWLTQICKDRVPKVTVEEFKAQLKVLKIFSRTKNDQIVGGKVEKGTIAVGDKIKIFRREALIGDGEVKGLQQLKEKIREVEEGKECGALIEAKKEIAPGDKVEAYALVEK